MQKPILLAEFGRNGREKILHLVMKHGPGYALFLRHGLEPNIFPPGPSTQSISRIINVNVVSYDVNQPAAMAQGQGDLFMSPILQGWRMSFCFPKWTYFSLPLTYAENRVCTKRDYCISLCFALFPFFCLYFCFVEYRCPRIIISHSYAYKWETNTFHFVVFVFPFDKNNSFIIYFHIYSKFCFLTIFEQLSANRSR